MSSTPLRRVVLTLAPAVVLAFFAGSTLWGERGLLERQRLMEHLEASDREGERIERDNQRLIRLLLLWDDPLTQERMVAERISWARPGSVLVRFDEVP